MSYSFKFHPVVWTLLIGTIFTRAASSMALPFLALYLSKTADVNPILIGITIGLGPLSSTLGGFVGGFLSDRFGRKRIMMYAITVWTLVYFGFAFAEHIMTFMLLNALNGLCRSFFEPASQAMIGDVTQSNMRKRVFSLRYTAINVGAAIGPMIGVYVAIISSSLPFIITGVMYGLYGIALLRIFSKFEVTQKSPEKKLLLSDTLSVLIKDRTLLLFIFGGLLINFGYSQIDSTLPQFLNMSFSDGVVLFSFLISLNAIVVIILQLPLSLLSEKWPVMKTIIIGSILMAIGFAGFGVSPSPFWLIISMAVVTIGEIFIFPSTSVFIDQIAPEDRRGSYFGAGQFRNIGNFTGPIIGGWLLIEFGGQLFIVVAIIIFCSIFFFASGNRKFRLPS